MANAFVAHAQTRLADAHMAEWDTYLSLPASNLAREEYAHGHALFSALLDAQPEHYSDRRQHSVHRATIGQNMRPIPLHMTTEDARAANAGVVAG